MKFCPMPSYDLEAFYRDIYPQRSSGPGIFYDARHPLLDAKITSEEIRQVLCKIANDKTPGSAGINNAFYAGLPNCWVKYITDIFNLALKHEYVPEDWCASLVVIIYKKGNHLDPINYRGISRCCEMMKKGTKFVLHSNFEENFFFFSIDSISHLLS